MPYEITHDIYHVDEPEGYDAPQEVTTELEQAEERIEALEGKLAKAVKALDEAVYLLGPDEEDMMMKAGVYRVVTTLAELKGQ